MQNGTNLLPQMYKVALCPENIRSQICNSLSNPPGNKNPSSFSKNKSIRYKANYSKYQWTEGKQKHGGNMCMLGNQADAMIQWKF